MSAQETEDQVGGAEAFTETTAPETVEGGASGELSDPSAPAAEGIATAPAKTAGESEPTATNSAIEAPLAQTQAEVEAGIPQGDAPATPLDQLHADAVKFIIAARLLGINAAEFVKAKIEEIAD